MAQSFLQFGAHMVYHSNMNDADWRKRLTTEQYRVLRQKGTEAPFSGELLFNQDAGMYTCAACGTPLFNSATKFESHCGWPSFNDITDSDAVKLVTDSSHGMERTEVICSSCDGHLGHLFEDSPSQPTGLRYCINSVSLDFKSEYTI